MPERVFVNSADPLAGYPNWGAIWAGTFAFVAIWSIFGFLGAAIFASVAGPSTTLAGMGLGMGIWAVVLTIIAMFVAGRVAQSLSGRTDPLMTATVTFGLSVTAALAIVFLARLALGATSLAGGALSSSVLGTLAGLGWAAFIALFLGWLAAGGGSWSATSRKVVESPAEVRRVA